MTVVVSRPRVSHAVAARLIFLAVALTIVGMLGCHADSAETDVVEIGPSGGRVVMAGVTLDVPPGAVERSVSFSVTADGQATEGYKVDGYVYRFAPADLHFTVPVSITFPTGKPGEFVFWTREGAPERFEQLETVLSDHRARALVRHFSQGFVGVATDPLPDGALSGVTCTVKRRVISAPDQPCTPSVTVEQSVAFWLSPHGTDPEGGLMTNQAGILSLYNTTQFGTPIFIATDETHALYRGTVEPGSAMDFGTGHRSGSTLTFTMNASRWGAYIGHCDTDPLVAVACSGTGRLVAGPPPVVFPDAGTSDVTADTPPDASTEDDVSTDRDGPEDAQNETIPPADSPQEAPPPDADTAGVTCTVKRRVSPPQPGEPCTQSVTVEQNVAFWLSTHNNDPQGGLMTNQAGILTLYNTGQFSSPIFLATDATHSLYRGAVEPGSPMDMGTGRRAGSILTFTMNASRTGIPPAGCETIPLVDVQCSGTGILVAGSPPVVRDAGTEFDTNEDAPSDAASGEDADRGATDAYDATNRPLDADASGVTCTVKRRVSPPQQGEPCTQSVTVEQNVAFWLSTYNNDPQGGLMTNQAGILTLYNTGQSASPIFLATDATHSLYRGAVEPGSPMDMGTGRRAGSILTFTMNASRTGTPPAGCETIPLVDVQCSGTGILVAGPPPVIRDAGGS
jgi:hypothetical protein